MTDRELFAQAVVALEYHTQQTRSISNTNLAIEALRARLAQPEPEPVAWWHDMGDVVDLNVSGRGVPLYTTPPQREWQGLTDEQVKQIEMSASSTLSAIYLAEAQLKGKNIG